MSLSHLLSMSQSDEFIDLCLKLINMLLINHILSLHNFATANSIFKQKT